jgi:hypothetical protein
LLACLTGCAADANAGPDQTDWKYESYKLSELDTRALHVGVRKTLKDPESARFGRAVGRKVFIPGKKPILQVCGYVNAKNGFGGYTGDKPFVGLLQLEGDRPFKLLMMGGTEIETEDVLLLCNEYGLLIQPY